MNEKSGRGVHRNPDSPPAIQERIADILRTEEAVSGSNVCVANCDRLARKLVAVLGLTEFTCDNDRWWATEIEDIA